MWSNPHHFADILETLHGVYARVVCRISACGHMLVVAGSTHCVNRTLCSTDHRGATMWTRRLVYLQFAKNMFPLDHDT